MKKTVLLAGLVFLSMNAFANDVHADTSKSRKAVLEDLATVFNPSYTLKASVYKVSDTSKNLIENGSVYIREGEKPLSTRVISEHKGVTSGFVVDGKLKKKKESDKEANIMSYSVIFPLDKSKEEFIDNDKKWSSVDVKMVTFHSEVELPNEKIMKSDSVTIDGTKYLIETEIQAEHVM